MRRLLFFALSFILTVQVCNSAEIEITGNILEYPDSTKVTLLNLDSNEQIATTFIQSHKFVFNITNTKAAAHGIFIGEDRSSEFLALFIEDVDISITGKKGEVKYAHVIGGEIQKQHNNYFNSRLTAELRLDSLTNELMSAMQAQDRDRVNSLSEQQINLINDGFKFGAKHIKEHPNEIYSAFTLFGLLNGLPKSEIKALYENFSPEVKESEYATSISQWLELNKTLKVGDIAEDFTLPDIHGKSVSLSSFKGKYTLLEFWKLGCSGCVNENKNILPLYEKYKDQNFDVISVSREPNIKQLKKGSEEFYITWHSLQDIDSDDGNVATRYGVTLVPSNFLIDPTGRIIAKNLKGKELEELLNEIL